MEEDDDTLFDQSLAGTMDLEGRLLVAMPGIGDDRFHRSVIFVCAYSDEGAMGIIVNRPNEKLSFKEVASHLNIWEESKDQMGSTPVDIPVMAGGPVEANRGFVLHSPDYDNGEYTLKTGCGVRMTATLDVLQSIVKGEGPQKSLIALGYAGWAAGQLEEEILANGWLTMDTDPDILFALPFKARYDAALGLLGIDGTHLSSFKGNA